MSFEVLSNRWPCVRAMCRSRSMLSMCSTFTKCTPLQALSKIPLSGSCLTRHSKAARLINGSLRSATLHIPPEVAGLVVGVRLFIIFQIKMSLGAPLELLTCFKCPFLTVCPRSNEFTGCLARNVGSQISFSPRATMLKNRTLFEH